jgi:hypothetical protein
MLSNYKNITTTGCYIHDYFQWLPRKVWSKNNPSVDYTTEITVVFLHLLYPCLRFNARQRIGRPGHAINSISVRTELVVALRPLQK